MTAKSLRELVDRQVFVAARDNGADFVAAFMCFRRNHVAHRAVAD
jgi:hypothetical protein